LGSPAAGTARSGAPLPTVGIVGGGIAGLYCAWHLLDRGYRVTLYEMLDRLGGRIETARELGGETGFTAEFGPMRFEPEIQPLFHDLCKRLDIGLVPFPPPSSDRDTGPPRLGPDESREGVALPADELLKLGVFRMFGADPNTEHKPLWLETLDLVPRHRPKGWQHPLRDTLDEEWSLEAIRAETTVFPGPLRLEGTPWWQLGFWNALSEELSHRAVIYIRDTGTFYHLIPDNPNAVEWAIFWLRLFQLQVVQSEDRLHLNTIPTGVYTIVEKLEEELERPEFELKLRHEVVGVSMGSAPGKVRLDVDEKRGGSTRSTVAEFDHVILALPRSPLVRLSEHFPEDIRTEKLDSVIGFPLLKAFLVVRDPWWQDVPVPSELDTEEQQELVKKGKIPIMSHRNASTVPTRELHYFVRHDTNPRTGMVMLYTDHPATEYWKTLVRKDGEGKHSSAAIYHAGRDNLPLKHALLHYLGSDRRRVEAEPSGSVDERVDDATSLGTAVDAYAIHDWSCEPFGAGCHAWKPGVRSFEVRQRLPAFALESANQRVKNVHICGEAYSDYQGFIEGALQTALDVVVSIDGQCPICD
jgi:hypothetical protein